MSREIQSKREALSLFMLIFLQIMFGIITHYLSQTHTFTNKQKLMIKISNRKSKYAEAYLWPKANEYKELRSVKKYPENEQRLLFITHFFSPIHTFTPSNPAPVTSSLETTKNILESLKKNKCTSFIPLFLCFVLISNRWGALRQNLSKIKSPNNWGNHIDIPYIHVGYCEAFCDCLFIFLKIISRLKSIQVY